MEVAGVSNAFDGHPHRLSRALFATRGATVRS